MRGNVSRETLSSLEVYKDHLIRWNSKINLIAQSTVSDIWQRHMNDSLQIADYVSPESGHWVDMGSGGGFPGIVLAIAFQDRPVTFTLIESDGRKSAFLRSAARSLGLKNVTVINQRIEAVQPLNADFVSARALARMLNLMPYLSRHLARTGQAWLLKGKHWKDEISEAKQDWAFNYRVFPSKSESEAAILQIDGISHV